MTDDGETRRDAADDNPQPDGMTANQTAEVVHLRPPKPELQKPNIDGEPTHPAKSAPYWLMWRAEQPRSGKQKWRKVPYIAQAGKPVAASSTDPLTWRTYDQAVQTYRMSQNWPRPYDGIGLVFDGAVGDDGLCFCGIDLDAWTEKAQAIVAKLATYTEISPSGNGVHIIARAKRFAQKTCDTAGLKAEAYSTGRYFTFTGRRIQDAPETIEARPDEIAEVVMEIARAGSGGQRDNNTTKANPASINDDLTTLSPGPFDLAKLSSAIMALPDVMIADEGFWMNTLCRALANEAMRCGDDPELTEQLYALLDARSRNAAGYNEEDNRDRFERCKDECGGTDRPVTCGTIYQRAEENGWSWTPTVTPGVTSPQAPLVGGKILQSALPPQTLQDVPGKRAQIMEALDRRLAADPYTFQSGDRLISLRMSPGAAILFPQIVDRVPVDGGTVTTPAVTDEGDMPLMLETTDADVLYHADLDHWWGYTSGRIKAGEAPKLRRVHAPSETCKLYTKLSRAKLGIRPLLGLARVPIIDDAGSLDFGVGYHAPTGIFRDRTPTLDVPDSPTWEDCRTQLRLLLTPFQEYKFGDQRMGGALILTFILTAIERPFIRTAPMFGFNGVAGVGKGKLLRAVSQLAFATSPRFITYGFNAEEFDKRIGTMFRIPAPCMVIDNANSRTISNDALESIISEGEGDVRTLGRSEFIHVVSRSLLAATGRGLGFSGDMTRRVLNLNPLATDASPETRVFRLDPPTYVAIHRNELLSAAFTLMRAFRKAGMPKLTKTSVGSFPEWERRVRDLVMWLTSIDVAEEFARNRETANDKQTDAMVVRALRGVFSNAPFTTGAVMNIYDEFAMNKRMGRMPDLKDPEQAAQAVIKFARTEKDKAEAPQKAEKQRQGAIVHNAKVALYDALEEFAGDKPVNAKRLGWWARAVENAYIGELRLIRVTKDGESAKLCILAEGVSKA